MQYLVELDRNVFSPHKVEFVSSITEEVLSANHFYYTFYVQFVSGTKLYWRSVKCNKTIPKYNQKQLQYALDEHERMVNAIWSNPAPENIESFDSYQTDDDD